MYWTYWFTVLSRNPTRKVFGREFHKCSIVDPVGVDVMIACIIESLKISL